MVKNSIDPGKVAEYRFAAEMLERGLIPCWPSTAHKPYDLLCDTSNGPIRIQVKGTEQQGRSISVKFKMKQGKRERRYTKKDVDFIVLHVVSFDAWYILPVEEVGIGITVKPGVPDCCYTKYLSAWHLLEPKVGS